MIRFRLTVFERFTEPGTSGDGQNERQKVSNEPKRAAGLSPGTALPGLMMAGQNKEEKL